ncbi:hypothetical protein [Pontibacter flavimaris]|uniref:Uncharacterized protein n=1 Tax=Pontibacter flavimaris TaxID=1797110 RepID=A0A1Q5PCS1_9BACT|nr:hypothetical protein [Pontibacter flavimaris]OKL39997.1 hypothetical protein A3841_16680 [Pontibacter flavimaris]
MKHLKKFLTRLQTFQLRVTQRKVRQGSPVQIREVAAYDIRHETPHDAPSIFVSELRLLSDLATLDLVSLDTAQLRSADDLLQTVEDRFNTFWVNYHNYSSDFRWEDFPSGYVFMVGLDKLFVVQNLSPVHSHVLIEETFVDDLGDSVRLRESLLASLRQRINSLVPPDQAQGNTPSSPLSNKRVNSIPRFVEGMAEEFFHILKGYFSPQDQEQLLPLLRENASPAAPLVFHGNGNQLADAFKQLYEANLIVGCLKSNLEDWISRHFAYVYRKRQRTLPAGYLAAIISSNAKPCQSPILDVRKQPDGTYAVIPVIRTQKNYNS